jgi:hypothetical protein
MKIKLGLITSALSGAATGGRRVKVVKTDFGFERVTKYREETHDKTKRRTMFRSSDSGNRHCAILVRATDSRSPTYDIVVGLLARLDKRRRCRWRFLGFRTYEAKWSQGLKES